MYRTCMSCKKSLGANEVLEDFPVGRRLAYDSAKGRLWAPRRPEFAAWRYGDQLGERKRKSVISAAAMLGCVGVAALFSAVILAAVPAVVMSPLLFGASAWLHLRPAAKVRVGETGEAGPIMPRSVVKFRALDLQTIQLLPHSGEPGFFVRILKSGRQARFEGKNARRVAAGILPLFNGWGGSARTVQGAVEEIESSGHPSRFLIDVTSRKSRPRGSFGYVRSMPTPTRFALEMALHEERERRALEGELRALELAWKEAEEIAAISDSLLLPARSDEFFRRHGREG